MDVKTLKTRACGISLGMFAADLGDLRKVANDVVNWGCDILHFDIMDGVFVPSMVGGPGFVKALAVGGLRDVHLMVENPAEHVASYVTAGADMITVHAESNNAADAINTIRAAATKANRPVLAGLCLMPGTTLKEAQELLDLKPDMILVLSLDPRDKNPPDITKACNRLRQLRTLYGPVSEGGPVLAFDGGVTAQSIAEITTCAPDMVVSGSAVLGADNPETAYKTMETALS